MEDYGTCKEMKYTVTLLVKHEKHTYLIVAATLSIDVFMCIYYSLMHAK